MRVLVIDDDPAIAAMLRQSAPPSWIIESAADGTVGLDRIRRAAGEVHAVILDIQMPYDGVLTCIQIRRMAPRLPIIPCTAYADHVATLIDMGCQPAVLKPTTSEALVVAVTQALQRSPAHLSAHPVWRYLEVVARREEHAVRRARRQWAGIVMGATEMRLGMLVTLMDKAGSAVVAQGTTADRDMLCRAAAQSSVSFVIADERALHPGIALAQTIQRPLLVVTLVPSYGYHAWRVMQTTGIGGAVLVDPVSVPILRSVLGLMADEPLARWRDPWLDWILTNHFRQNERPIVEMIVSGAGNDEIAQHTGYRPQTVRSMRARIFTAIGHPGDGASNVMCEWINEQMRHRPALDRPHPEQVEEAETSSCRSDSAPERNDRAHPNHRAGARRAVGDRE